MFRKMTAMILTLAMVMTFLLLGAVSAYAADSQDIGNYSFDKAAHNAQQKSLPDISLFASYVGGSGSMIENEYLQFYVGKDMGESVDDGRFTIGNTGGNPNYPNDDNKILLFGHPNPWSSYTTIRINGADYIFNANNTTYDTANLKAVSTMTVDNILVTQTLQIVKNDTTAIKDTVKISYSVKNLSSASKSVGVRIMMDTMLGDNDGAPFKVPGYGNVTKELELRGNAVPQTWQAFDSFANATVFAVGTLYQSGDRKPNKVQFTNWSGVYSIENSWNYTTDPATPVTGDSAVAIYFDPTSVDGGATETVNTYYGVGRVEGNSGGSGGGSTTVPQNGYAVLVIDEDGMPVSGATVSTSNNLSPSVTNQDGIAIFANMPVNYPVSKTTNVTVSKAQYENISVSRDVSRGALVSVKVFKNDGKPHIIAVTTNFGGKLVDLLAGYSYFKEDKNNETSASSDKLSFVVEASGGVQIQKYQLLQGGAVKYESALSEFDLKTKTKTANDIRIEKLKSGQTVYLQVIDASGAASNQIALGLKVSDPSNYSDMSEKGSIKIGKDLKITVPDNVPIIGNTEIELGWANKMPVQIDVGLDGKVKFAVNAKTPPAGSYDIDGYWTSVKDDYEKALASAASNRASAAGAFGGKPQPFKATSAEIKGNLMGYGEGYIDKNGNLLLNVGVVATISAGTSYTQTYFVGFVPIYGSIGLKGEAKGTFQLSVQKPSNGGLDDFRVSGGVGKFEPSITLNLDGGVGVNNVLNIGASGRAKLAALYNFVDDHQRLSLTGSMYIVAQAFLFKAEKKFAEGTWTIYDSYARQALMADGANSQDFFDSDDYVMIPRTSSLSAGFEANSFKVAAANTSTVQSNVFPNAMPKLVKVGSDSYAFWLQDIESRSDENRTALVYSVSADTQAWSAPKQLIAEDSASTADFNFDLAVEGNDIYVIWIKANKQLDPGVVLDDMSASLEIYYAKLDTTTETVTVEFRLTSDSYADMMPAISLDGDFVAWASNALDGGTGVFGKGNTYTLNYASTSDLSVKNTVPDTTGAAAVITSLDVGTYATTSDLSAENTVPDTTGAAAAITGLDVGVLGSARYVVFSKDTDGDLNTNDDEEIYLLSVSDGNVTQLTDNSVVDSVPQFGMLNGVSTLFWYSDGDVLYTTDGSDIKTVFGDNKPSNISDGFEVIGDNLIWEAIAETADENAPITTAFYATKFSGSSWSPVYKLSDTNNELTSRLSGYVNGDTTYVAFVETLNANSGTPVSSVKVAALEPETDIALVGAYYELDDVKLGEALPLTVSVANKGSEAVDSFDVYVGGDKIATVSSAGLGLGETKEYTVDGFTVPSALAGTTDFEVRVETSMENNVSDNSFTMKLGFTDLAVQSVRQLSNGQDCANVIVSNNSDIESGATLIILADGMDGAVLYEKHIDNITSENSYSLLVNLDELSGGAPIETYYFSVTANGDELYTGNNTDLIYLGQGSESRYSLTVQSGTGGSIDGVSDGQYVAGETINISATAESGYVFDRWTSSNGGVFASATDRATTFTMPSNDVVITANFRPASGGGSSGSGGSGGGSTAPSQTFPAAGGAVQVNYTIANGKATLSLPTATVNEIIEKSKNNEAILDLSKVSGATAASMPKDALISFSKAGLAMTMKLPIGTITLNKDAVASVAQQASGSDVTIEMKQATVNSLSAAQKKSVKSGDVVLDINIISGSKKISTFDGTLSVQMPYTGLQPVAVWYLNDKGELEKLNCTFKNGVVSFDLDHLSLYVVGQDTSKSAWANPFTDVKEADWFYAAVNFCAEKGITNGTSATTFSPDATLTRGQFVTMLLKAYGIESIAAPTDNFADAGNTYYTGYLAAAKAKKIANGVGDNKFAPERAITRQEMFTLLYNALKELNKLPAADNGKTLADFADSSIVASWATDAMAALVKSGTISGSSDKLDPTGCSNRAQMAQVLYNLLEQVA